MRALEATVLQRLLAQVMGAAFDLQARSVNAGLGGEAHGWPTATVALVGSCTLRLWIAIKPELGCHLVARAVGCEVYQVDTPMIQDAALELTNMIAGQVKATLGAEMRIGLPEACGPCTGPMLSQSYLAALEQDKVDLYVGAAMQKAF